MAQSFYRFELHCAGTNYTKKQDEDIRPGGGNTASRESFLLFHSLS
jgi:hypothetical protein